MRQKNFGLSRTVVAIGLAMWVSFAVADPNVKIISPADGVTVGAGESLDVVYDIVPNPGGDHLHIYVNNKEAGILRKQKGKYTLDPLPAGTNTVCLKVVNKGHASIGQETCIKVIRK
jgi:hypothetical protein